jgi:hypothetical protein
MDQNQWKSMGIVGSDIAGSPLHAMDVMYKLGNRTRCKLKHMQPLVEGQQKPVEANIQRVYGSDRSISTTGCRVQGDGWNQWVRGSGKCPKCRLHGNVLEECSWVKDNVF